MDSSVSSPQLHLASVRPWTPPHTHVPPARGLDPGPEPDQQLQPTQTLGSLRPFFGPSHTRPSSTTNRPPSPFPPASQVSHLSHAGVLHELVLLPSSQLLWRKAGHPPVDLSPTPPLTTRSACLCYLPRWTPSPVALQLLSDGLLKCTDLGTGAVRWSAPLLPGRATRVVRLGSNGAAIMCADPTGAHLVCVLVDHPLAEQSVLAAHLDADAATGAPAGRVQYTNPPATRVVADGNVWASAGNGEVHVFTVTRAPEVNVRPGMPVVEVDDEWTVMEAVDESFVVEAAAPALALTTAAAAAAASGSRRSRSSGSAAASAAAGTGMSASIKSGASRKSGPPAVSKKSSRSSISGTPATATPAHSPPPATASATATPAAAAAADSARHQHEKDRANATVLHTQPLRTPRSALALALATNNLSAARVVLVRAYAVEIHAPVVDVVECEDARGRMCVGMHFADGTVRVHVVDEAVGWDQRWAPVAVFERVTCMAGVRVWGRRAVAVATDTGRVHVWAGHERVLDVDVSAHRLVMGLGDGLLFRDEDKGGYVHAALVSRRWDKSPDMRCVLDVLGAVLPLDAFVAVRDTDKVADPLSALILTGVATSAPGVHRRALLCAVSVALFMLVQEWALNDLTRRSARYLAEALVPVLVEIGWAQHVEYLAHRYFADRIDRVVGRLEEKLAADVDEPRPTCLVAFAESGGGQEWPTLSDLRIRFGLHDEPPATPGVADQDVFPMTSALAHLLHRLHTSTCPETLLEHLSPALAHLHSLWQESRARFSALPLGWRMLVTSTVELARLEPEYVGALPFSATTFLDRADLAFGAQPPPPCATPEPSSSSSATTTAQVDADDPSEHTLHDPHDLSMARQLLTLPATIHVAYAYKYVKLGRAEHLENQEQDAVIDRTIARVLAVYPGAAALDFKSITYTGFSPANPVPLPISVDINFKVRASGDVACDPVRLVIPPADANDKEYNWILFHAGVAKALGMQLPSTLSAGPRPPASGADDADADADPFVAWLWTTKPTPASRPWPASLGGWYLGLGLLGYLSNMPSELLLQLIAQPPTLTLQPVLAQPQIDAGVLVGVAASHVGSASKHLHGMLVLLAPKVFNVAAAGEGAGADVPPDQPLLAAVLAMGLVMARTGSEEVARDLFENAVCEAHAVRPRADLVGAAAGHPGSASGGWKIGDPVAGEGLRVVAAVALAFVLVGQADRRWIARLAPLWDEKMSGRIVAVTAAPAWIVFGWVFWNCKLDEVRNRCRIGRVASAEVKEMEGKVLYYRAVASFLVEWDDVDVGYVTRVRAKVRREVKEAGGNVLAQMAADTVVTAAVYVLAIKCAGTADQDAAKLCWDLVDELVSRLHCDPDIVRQLDPNNAPGNPTPLDLQASHQANHWLYTAHLSAALILSGTGDRHAYRRLVRLQQRTGPNITYGLHSQANLALGQLFCGRGKHAVRSTSPISALALFASTLPCFTPTSQADETTTLHAMSHLWVLAAKATVVNAVSLASGEHVAVRATLSTEASSGGDANANDAMGSVATTITFPHKFELPLPATSAAWTLSIDDPAWYPLTLLVDDLVAGNSTGGRAVYLLPKDGITLASHKHASRVVKAVIPGKVQQMLGQLMHAVVSDSLGEHVRALEAVRLVNARVVKLRLFAAVDRAYAGPGEGVSRIAVEVERVRQLVLSKYPQPAFAGPVVEHVAAVAGERGTVLHGLLSVARSEAGAAGLWEVASRAVFHGVLMSTKLVQEHVEVARAADELGIDEDTDGFLRMLVCDDDSMLML